MKRSHSLSSSSVEGQEIPHQLSPLVGVSQASVPGADQACTPIAVVACASMLFPLSSSHDRETWIWQGAALYASWRQTSAQTHAFAKEIVDMVSAALPIGVDFEHGGPLSSIGDGVALLHPDDGVAVLTVGAVSMALLRGGLELFDSHAHEDGAAVSIRFASRDALLVYLLQRFPDHSVPMALCAVKKRDFRVPRAFPTQELAFVHADRLPPGFFYVWARDLARSGRKEYVVAGLEDFFHHYAAILDPSSRTHYDMARTNRPVTLYMDLEFDGYEENANDDRVMLDTLLKVVAQVYAEDNPGAAVVDDLMQAFRVTDASKSAQVRDMSMSSDGDDHDDDEEEEEDDEEDSVSQSLDEEAPPPAAAAALLMSSSSEFDPDADLSKVSYHVHNHLMWFSGTGSLGRFMEERVRERGMTDPLLRVWRKTWNATERTHEMTKQFFADMGVYTRNRCMRLPFATKFGQNRFFLPLDGGDLVDVSLLYDTVLSPPHKQLYSMQQAPEEEEHVSTATRGGSDGELVALSRAPGPIRALGEAIERHYCPNRMRGFQLAPTGLVTFSMVKRDCEICQDRHNNQVYAVADLKRRVFFQKCHVDRTKTGKEVPFPDSLGTLSMVNEAEMQVDGVFPAQSSTARLLLGFAGAIYQSARSAPTLPQPGTCDVHYDASVPRYEVTLADVCLLDHGTQVLQVTPSKLVIRCKGKRCAARGKRWDRPSHSSANPVTWKLSFLFPEASSSSSPLALVVGAFPGDASPESFLAESDFLRALGFEGLNGAPFSMYQERLQHIEKWASTRQKAHDTIDELAHRVLHKCRIMGRILGNEMMEACYRECLRVAPDFAYPIQLIPRGPITLSSALWIHLARRHGYKRVEKDFYVPVEDDAGRTFYKVVPIDQLATSVCTFDVTPNLCAAVLWNGRMCDDLRRLLMDANHFPSTPISKRYLGYANVVYDLEQNEALSWDEVRANPAVLPFNFLDQHFPVEALERAKHHCPEVAVERNEETNEPEVRFSHHRLDFVPTPLFDGPLHDQGFSTTIIFWLYALLGRLFYYVGKDGTGDNWEAMVFLLGAPGSFKSSTSSIVQRYFQPSQVGIIGTRVESQFPLDDMVSKLLAVMTECSGCTLDRDLLKLIGSGDPVRIAGKFKTAINVPFWSVPLLFAGNAYLSVRDTDGSLLRRSVVFPFLRMLRPGQGITDLADRIFQDEGPLLLIKWNTLYLKMRATIHQRIHSLLPADIREATRQSMHVGDSFKAFFAREMVVTGRAEDSVTWERLWAAYKAWCKHHGREPYTVDPAGMEAQAMFASLGVRVSRSHGPLSLERARPRRTPEDPPFRNVLEVGHVHREGE